VILFTTLCATIAVAQKKNTQDTTAKKKVTDTTAKKSLKKSGEKKAPTIIYKEAQTEIIPLYETKKTVIKLSPSTGSKIDTIFAKKKRKGDTTTIVDTGKKIRIIRDTGICQCIAMEVIAPDTLVFGEYITYRFSFTNNCKEMVYIHSSSFRFTPVGTTGKPVKVLRKVAFVKRFDIPEYVKLSPKENYQFKFADDPFFEFDLQKGEAYKFVFMYNNASQKPGQPKFKTYMCTEWRDRKIFVK
jgi:hypothetical protein